MITCTIINTIVGGVMLCSAIIVYKAFASIKPLVSAYKQNLQKGKAK